MTPVFADTYYYIALLSEDDAAHEQAVRLSRTLRDPIVTTAWVLTEVADALAGTRKRGLLLSLVQSQRADAHVSLIEAERGLFDRGIELYSQRPDKAWSLTDCISFVVMKDLNLSDALTGDHHFEQAGFRILFK